MSKKKLKEEKLQHALLDLERVNIKLGQLSERAYLKMLKQNKNVTVKKMSWKIRKIITRDGEYIPSKDCSVILISYPNSKQKVKPITVTKQKINLRTKAKETKKAQVA